MKYALIVAIGTLVAGALSYWLDSSVSFVEVDEAGSWFPEFRARFQIMFVISVLIERSVDIYLKATDQQGIERYDPDRHVLEKIRDATPAALRANLVLSLFVAVSGVRIIETLVTFSDGEGVGFWSGLIKPSIWYGVDVVVSAGLMAGGADLFHKVTKVITGGLDRTWLAVTGKSRDGVSPRIDDTTRTFSAAAVSIAALTSLAALKTYTVRITRPSAANSDEGVLNFTDGSVTINVRCWWDKTNRISAGTYKSCSKTYMNKSKIEAIYLPDAVSKATGAKEIFIHRGSGPANSLGCIAVETDAFATLWNHIAPMNGFNITVIVADA